MKLTDQDRRDYPYYTDGSIRGIKLVKRIPDAVLLNLLNEPAEQFERMRQAIGADTNPNWLTSEIAQELYRRDLIDDQTFELLS